MQTTLADPTDWAREEFLGAELGDARRNRRLVAVAAALAKESHGTLPESFGSWSELKAAYRLLKEPDVTYAALLRPHWNRTRQECREPGQYLLVEDSTELDFTSHEDLQGMGSIGNGGGKGMLVHTTLALRLHGWDEHQEPQVTVVGLWAQQCWVRTALKGSTREGTRVRLRRDRESQRWAAAFVGITPCQPESIWTFMADRESDIFETFERCEESRMHVLIRASHPRTLAEEDGSLWEAAAAAPVKGRFTLHLRGRPAQIKKAKHKGKRQSVRRPKLPGRDVDLEVRSRRVMLRAPWRPGGAGAPRAVNVVEVREVNPPAEAEPVHWVLLTDWPVEDLAACMRVARAYSCRWLIEEYHKALKTGTRVESSQLTTAKKIETLLGILALVAVRLLNMKLLARVEPDHPLEAGELSVEAIAILEAHYGVPSGGWTYEKTLRAIARLGGFLARKSDGSPGWITIWRGWGKLQLMTLGAEIANRGKCG